MFYINRNLKTELSFSHYNMDRLHNDDDIMRKLREKVEGRCLPEYGYILQVNHPFIKGNPQERQVTKNPHARSSCGIEIGVPRIDN